MKKLISITTPTYNEEENVRAFYMKIKEIMSNQQKYNYEHIFIDNASEDRTVEILKEIAKKDKNVKVIVNTRNFGDVRSPYYALLQAKGDAIVTLAADFQDSPELIPKFIEKWEHGFKIVIGVRTGSQETFMLGLMKKIYYNLIYKLSNIKIIKNFTGFGLYDREIIEIFRQIEDPQPYLRGLVCDLGYNIAKIYFTRPKRKKGISKHNFYTLYDTAMLGIINHSKIPLRLATMFGFLASIISLIIALVYFVYKILFWESFSLGIAPLVIGIFFFFSINLFFLGILGEYIGAILTQVLKRPLVIEKQRINFEEKTKNENINNRRKRIYSSKSF